MIHLGTINVTHIATNATGTMMLQCGEISAIINNFKTALITLDKKMSHLESPYIKLENKSIT